MTNVFKQENVKYIEWNVATPSQVSGRNTRYSTHNAYSTHSRFTVFNTGNTFNTGYGTGRGGIWRDVSEGFLYQDCNCKLEFSINTYDGESCLYFKSSKTLPVDVTVCVVSSSENVVDHVKCSISSENEKIWTHTSSLLSCSLTFELIFHAAYSTDDKCIQTEFSSDDKCIQTLSYLSNNVSIGSLPGDFSKLLETGSDHDVEIKCGKNSTKTHKLILSARSDVFRSMLQNDMLEGHTGVIEIQNMDVSHFIEFVKYLYTDVLSELTFDKAKVFYKAGDKYAIRNLMLQCAEYLQDNLSLENAFECCALADAHSDEKMKDKIISFVLDKKIYLQDEYWSPFYENIPKVALEVYRLSVKDSNTCTDNCTVSYKDKKKCLQTASYVNASTSTGSLQEDISKLLQTELDHDVEMKCGGHVFKTHKLILCARSDVFKVMLNSDMLEGQTKVIEIQDIDVNYFQDFIKYLYTDVITEITFDKAKVFYEAGDKYAIRNLMLRCSDYLQDSLSPENVFECYALADAHSDQNLKNEIIAFVLHKKIYLQENHWLPFCENFPNAALEVYSTSYKKNKEK